MSKDFVYSKQSGIPVRSEHGKHDGYTFCACNECELKRNNAGNHRSKNIKQIDLDGINVNDFKKQCVACIVLTHDNKILLQRRGENWKHFPGLLCTFGGHIENNESAMQALIRELHEELGAIVKEADVIYLGAYTEKCSNYSDLIYSYFWHDKLDTITGCYEGEARYFNDAAEIMQQSKIMEDIPYLLQICSKLKLI